MAQSSSETDNESQHRHHKKKEKNHKKTKKRYRSKSDDEEKGYKKIKRKKEKKRKKDEIEKRDGSEQKSTASVEPFLVKSSPDETHNKEIIDFNYGPILPPHLLNNPDKSKPSYIGPALPPKSENLQDHLQIISSSNQEENDEYVGPLPGVTNTALEQRALELKLGKVTKSEFKEAQQEKAREEWMIELPQVKTVTDLGLGARQFLTKERPDFSDRSSWTNVPQDRKEKSSKMSAEVDFKKQQEVELQKKLFKEHDEHQEKVAKEHKKKHKRNKSLLELHQDKLNKAKKEKEDEPKSRRPFDRNVDLQANRFDEAQKKAVIKKAQLLDSRFSSGSSKFL